MDKQGLIPESCPSAATKRPTGFVTSVQRVSHTSGQPLWETYVMEGAVRAVTAGKLAFAIRFKPCIQRLQLSGTMTGMTALPLTMQLSQKRRHGGTTARGEALKPGSQSEPGPRRSLSRYARMEAPLMLSAQAHSCSLILLSVAFFPVLSSRNNLT